MTAIAYRAGVLAADTQVEWEGEIKSQERDKVFKSRGYLIGISGNKCPSNRVFTTWYFERKDKPIGKRYSFQTIVIHPDRTVEIIDQSGDSQIYTGEFFSVGSGAQVCLGAMEMGASAEQAVAVAIKWCPGVGGEVVTVEL